MNIGGAAAASGVSQRMIRHYEKIGLIPSPPRRDSGYRDYSDADIHRLQFIANARDLGFPIEEIRVLLDLWSDRDRASAEVKALAESRAADLGRKADALNAMRGALLGSGLIDQSQKMTVAARATAEKKAFGHRS